MGWGQLLAWRRELSRSVTARNRANVTDPDSWDGVESDGWWQQARAKGKR
jgi:hypothetical protein